MTRPTRSDRTRQLAGLAPVIPVLVIPDAGLAADLGRTLIGAGLPVLEVTLRTDGAFDAIRAMADLPGGHVGAGTVLTADDARRARDNGATFAVSPGLTDAIVAACDEIDLPLLPGVATASEAMAAREYGFDMLKLFPAEAVGGRALLKALSGPLPQLSFCPTGGITPETAPDYLTLPNVACVGGSWIAPEADQRARDWTAIGARARAAAGLTRG
ncbi:bifunctional 4-hydroxy-2-oxoglutarate aldolase/2-dehydro-3-deoxy-phosphogluconate aldolase [Paracoccus aeridis]|uniref:bifunctional 4-hydroxy-2-oxoglutarate aldolase/2-dehydro-3-deoxy-phosphogluconate aldolase n=1 Tax=Paracoccus aeridis TaxID=1966466 RepID=UPI0010AAC79B|nr:bifunctional 4-hydroxy-2-oxoglutarate aldolase/2-dehydro-3-deoxy-phosphogluconate aldolase [Paracoccus aeridis]